MESILDMRIGEIPYNRRAHVADAKVYDRVTEWTGNLSQSQISLNGNRYQIFENGGVIRYDFEKRTIELSEKIDSFVQFAIGYLIKTGNGDK